MKDKENNILSDNITEVKKTPPCVGHDLASETGAVKSQTIDGYFIDQETLHQLTQIIGKIPTEFGLPLITILNNKLIKKTYNG